MAVVVFSAAPINMGDPIHLADLLASDPSGAPSSTAFAFVNSATSEFYQFQGSGFGGFIDGAPTTGTLTGVTYSVSGAQQVSITGFSVSIASVYPYLAAGDWTGAAGLILAGNETVAGSALDDLLLGYGGADTLFGGAGQDTVGGGAGSDVVHGGQGNDVLDGDVLNAASGVDALFGDEGDDTMVGDAPGDTLDGGAGIDTAVLTRAGAQNLTIDMTQWSSEAGVTLSDGTVLRNVEAFSISSGGAADTFTLVGAPQTLSAINGGGGDDLLIADFTGNGEALNLAHSQSEQGTLRIGEYADLHWVTLYDFERYQITGGEGSDFLAGMSANDVFEGGGGNDNLSGAGGDDTLSGGDGADVLGDDDGLYSVAAGNDLMNGGAGDDTLVAGGGHNTLSGGAGDDTLRTGGSESDGSYIASVDDLDGGDGIDLITLNRVGAATAFTLTSSELASASGFTLADGVTMRNFERFWITLGDGDDSFTLDSALEGANFLDARGGSNSFTADLSSATSAITYESGSLTTDGGALASYGFQNVVFASGSGNDRLAASGYGVVRLSGNEGMDTLIGGGGSNTLLGGAGDDAITSFGVDSIDGGDGVDLLVLNRGGATQNLTIALGAGGALGDGGSIHNVERVEASTGAGDDTLSITGANGDSIFSAGDGNDTLIVDYSGVASGVTLFVSGFTGAVSTQTGSVTFSNVESVQVSAGSGWDTLAGGAGNDRVSGGEGNDAIVGGAGLNTLLGGAGDDYLESAAAGDSLDGGAGVDYAVVNRSAGAFAISTAALASNAGQSIGDGTFVRNVETFSFTLGAGADTLTIDSALNGSSMFTGGGGANALVVNLASTAVALTLVAQDQGGGAFGSATTSTGSVFFQDIRSISVSAGSGSDTLFGAGGADTLSGGAGDDSLLGGGGADVFNGGSGVDIVTYELAGSGVSANFTTGVGAGGEAQGDTFVNVENLTGTSFADTLTGNNAANVIDGRDGNDSIAGGAGADLLQGRFGDDTLDGGAGADTMLGGGGDDVFYIDNAGDSVGEEADPGVDLVRSSVGVIALWQNVENLELLGAAVTGNGNAADNRITGNAANNSLNGMIGADTMIGGAGNDTYFVDNSGDVVTEAAGQGTDTVFAAVSFTLGANVENLTLNGNAELANGNSLNNVLTGNSNNNVLNGGSGEDTLAGGLGNDIYVVNSAGDVVNDTGGNGDTVLAYIDVAMLTANIENLTLAGAATMGAGNELNNNIVGNSLNNTLTGGLGNDSLNGSVGADTMSGGLGDDAYLVENAADVVNEDPGAGTDIVYAFISISGLAANVEKLTLMPAGGAIDGVANGLDNRLNGNDSNNVLTALGGADVIQGLGGDDRIIGGAGLDNIFGGAGNDVFVYQATSDSGVTGAARDLINDFTQGADTIDLSAIDAVVGGGDDAFSLIGASAFGHVAGQLRYDLIDASGAANDFTIISMDVNGDAVADSQITLRGLVSLAAGDFVL